MKILQVTKKFPWPPRDGEVIGIINLTLGFAALGHQVTVLSLNTKKHFFPPENLPERIKSCATFKSVNIDTDVRAWAAFTNLFTTKSYNIKRFYSQEFETLLTRTLTEGNFDIIILESTYLMQYISCIRAATTAKVLLRPQNVEHIIWQRLAAEKGGFLKRRYLKLLAARMKTFELDNINKADILMPVSEVDEDFFLQEGCRLPHKAIPTGYIFDELPCKFDNEMDAVAFIGGLDWAPNLKGIKWFIAEVWPKVHEKRPETRFHLAGRNFPSEIRDISVKGIQVIGEVDSAKDFILSCPVFVVPLFSGSGMRVKIIEAMALGRAVVSTSVGAESLHYTHEENIVIANDAESFAAAILKLLNNRADRLRLGNNAQRLIRTHYDNKVICNTIIDFVKPYLAT